MGEGVTELTNKHDEKTTFKNLDELEYDRISLLYKKYPQMGYSIFSTIVRFFDLTIYSFIWPIELNNSIDSSRNKLIIQDIEMVRIVAN